MNDQRIYEGFTRSELIDVLEECKSVISSIRCKIEFAKEQKREGFDYDPKWMRRAKHALSAWGVKHQQAQMELNRLRQDRQLSVERHFVNICESKLDKSLFIEIMTEAKKASEN